MEGLGRPKSSDFAPPSEKERMILTDREIQLAIEHKTTQAQIHLVEHGISADPDKEATRRSVG